MFGKGRIIFKERICPPVRKEFILAAAVFNFGDLYFYRFFFYFNFVAVIIWFLRFPAAINPPPLDFYFSVGRKQNNKKINAKTNIRPTFNNSPAHCCCLYFFPFLFSFPIEGGGINFGQRQK